MSTFNYYESEEYHTAINEACVVASQGEDGDWDSAFIKALKARGLQVKEISCEYVELEGPLMAPMPFSKGYVYPSHIVRIPS